MERKITDMALMRCFTFVLVCGWASGVFIGCGSGSSPGEECDEGLLRCDGVCVDPDVNVYNCGECGAKCAEGEICNEGVCVHYCPGGWTDCSGYCVDLQRDRHNCGECGNGCGLGEICNSGSCVLSCPPGLNNCGGQCVNMQYDPFNCGSCGKACVDGEVCSAGNCLHSCPEGFEDCNGSCVSLQNDLHHCGECDNPCEPGEVCSGGECGLTCGGSTPTMCDGGCVNTDTDLHHCGECDNLCEPGEVCSGGECGLTCGGSTPTMCDGGCVNTEINRHHCGECYKACDPGEVCSGGSCLASCGHGLVECYGVCVDAANDPMYCGDCDSVCPSGPNSTPVCIEGGCDLMCDFYWGNCDGNPLTGCNSDLLSDPDNCGMCSNECSAGGICREGICDYSKSFVIFATSIFLGSSESSWLNSRQEADAKCADEADALGIVGESWRIYYSTPDEDARDYLLYESSRGDRVFNVNGVQIDEGNLWGGHSVILPDLPNFTITGTGPDGRFMECTGSDPSGSWPLCQYCNQKFACVGQGENFLDPERCCWTGTRAILCMGSID